MNIQIVFLQLKEKRIRDITGHAYTKMGMELKEVRDKLAGNNQYNGYFDRWIQSIGLKKDTVYRLINRYELVVANCDEQNRIEELPLSLSYEISKPSADEELKQDVLDGNISTLKELRQAIKDKKELEQKIEELENQEPRVVEKPVPVEPDDYQYYKDKHFEQSSTIRSLNELMKGLNSKVQDKEYELEKAKNEKIGRAHV